MTNTIAFLPFLFFLSFCYLYWSRIKRAKRSESLHLQSQPKTAKGKQKDVESDLHRTHPTKAMQKEDAKIEIHGILVEEIIVDILSRLPVKSLIRFKCLSKGFKNLFQSPTFIDEHLHFSNQSSSSLLLHRIERESHGMESCSTLRFIPGKTPNTSLINSPSNITLPIEQAFPILDPDIKIEGSSNGLLCLTTKTLIFIWNPSTRQVKQLPKPKSIVTKSTSFSIGFTSVVNDYKVLLIQPEITDGFEVYSLKMGEWKHVDVAASSLQLHDASVCSYFIHMSLTATGLLPTKFVSTNGSCFGLIIESRKESEADKRLDLVTRLRKLTSNLEWILCFDLGTETFTKINVPDLPCLDERILATYKDSIALLINHRTIDQLINLWVHDKGQNCWSMLYSVTLNRPEYLLGLWKDEVLVTKRKSSDKAIFYTNNGEENKILAIIEFPLKFSFISVCDYVESLVSI